MPYRSPTETERAFLLTLARTLGPDHLADVLRTIRHAPSLQAAPAEPAAPSEPLTARAPKHSRWRHGEGRWAWHLVDNLTREAYCGTVGSGSAWAPFGLLRVSTAKACYTCQDLLRTEQHRDDAPVVPVPLPHGREARAWAPVGWAWRQEPGLSGWHLVSETTNKPCCAPRQTVSWAPLRRRYLPESGLVCQVCQRSWTTVDPQVPRAKRVPAPPAEDHVTVSTSDTAVHWSSGRVADEHHIIPAAEPIRPTTRPAPRPTQFLLYLVHGPHRLTLVATFRTRQAAEDGARHHNQDRPIIWRDVQFYSPFTDRALGIAEGTSRVMAAQTYLMVML